MQNRVSVAKSILVLATPAKMMESANRLRALTVQPTNVSALMDMMDTSS